MNKGFQAKQFSVVFYDDTDIDNRLFDLILEKCLVSYAYIKHDKDTNDDGSLKKTHYHLYLEFSKRVSDSFIRNYFNTEIVTKCLNTNYYISYFLHLYDVDKFQYDRDLIISYNINIDKCLNNVCITSDNETDMLNDIIEYIQAFNPSYIDLFHYVMRKGLFSVYKSNYTLIRDIIRFR